MFDPIWTGLIQFGQVWSNLDRFYPIWTSLIQFGHVRSNLDMFDPIWTTLIQFGQVRSNSDRFYPIWTVWSIWMGLIQFGQIWSNLDKVDPIWKRASLPGLDPPVLQHYLDLSPSLPKNLSKSASPSSPLLLSTWIAEAKAYPLSIIKSRLFWLQTL